MPVKIPDPHHHVIDLGLPVHGLPGLPAAVRDRPALGDGALYHAVLLLVYVRIRIRALPSAGRGFCF